MWFEGRSQRGQVKCKGRKNEKVQSLLKCKLPGPTQPHLHVHTDISAVTGVLHVLYGQHITHRIKTAGFHGLTAEALFVHDAGQLAALPMRDN